MGASKCDATGRLYEDEYNSSCFHLNKFILDVIGSAGAVWGFSEVVGLRTEGTVWFWRPVALLVGVVFLIRWMNQVQGSIKHRCRSETIEQCDESEQTVVQQIREQVCIGRITQEPEDVQQQNEATSAMATEEDEAKPAAQLPSGDLREQDLPPVNDFEVDDQDSLSDASDHAWDSDTLAAVARTTHHQMIKRQPILIGCNRDGSINVQLPNGNIIVAERSAFPKFDKQAPHIKIPGANRIKRDQFAYLTRKEKTYSDQIPTLAEIEHLLHPNASSIFLIFDRRVNLDLFPATCSNYELLRAWAQDDPYRYTPPSVDIPTEKQIRARKGLKLKRKATWNPNMTNISKALRQQSTPPSIKDLRAAMIQRGKHRRLIYTQHITTSDEAVLAQMADEGMFRLVQSGVK